ncbi:hypothetical protein SAMN04488005_1741 [Yoonia tamlensis]|uniref:DUF3299 domain-containing protein n=1 Tax=Yoonia tamlensis TaxID=390270 RepID=A0A1I6GIW5_9RHOB|nr:hypothetical protein [Yoonia tamlensis]SFR42163.1 hypothetical protein SAMN04488005_1741 [Yoonia tamlensis]
MKQVSTFALGAALCSTGTMTWAQSNDWDLLRGITIQEIVTETSYRVDKTYPPEIADGRKGMVLTGYAAPISAGSEISELILVSDMGFCPLCGDPDHGASIRVTLQTPVNGIQEGARITLRGDMIPDADPETWNAAILENAEIIRS